MIVKARGGGPRRNIPSAKRSKYQNMCPIIQGDVPGSAIDKDVHYEHTGRMGAGKYLRKNYYHRIKCSAANSLTALMRK